MNRSKRLIVLGSDHAGYKIKEHIKKYIQSLNDYEITDVGTNSEESCDFSDFAEKLCLEVLKDEKNLGIVVCGSGIGVSMTCNKIPGIRCALVHDYLSAQMSRLHTNCNVMALGQNSTGEKLAENEVDAFLKYEPLTEEKYLRRLKKVEEIEKKYANYKPENKN